jgi:hypothetical protein
MDKFLIPVDRWAQPRWAGGPRGQPTTAETQPAVAPPAVVCDQPGCATVTTRSNMCEVHLRDVMHVEIKTSSIPDAGDGVFTLRPIPKGEYLMQYVGRRVNASNGELGGDYHLEYARNKLVDASIPTSCVARFLNDGMTQKANNCMFALRDGDPWVRTIKLIPAGQELLLSYGAAYWRTWRTFHGQNAVARSHDLRRLHQAEADRQSRRKKTSRWQSLRSSTRRASASHDGPARVG